ncbi:hypothetical protein B0T17DRAFT_567640, partial [Bombardia bombarda]
IAAHLTLLIITNWYTLWKQLIATSLRVSLLIYLQPLVTKQQTRDTVNKKEEQSTYNTRDSLVVTDPTTSLALTCLSRAERTGCRVLKWIWSYVLD